MTATDPGAVGARRTLPHGAQVVQRLLDAETRPVPAALRAVGDTGSGPVPGASGVARRRYTDRSVHDLETDRVWRRVWQMACREEQIPEAGDSVVYSAPGVSLVVVRAEPGRIRAFHNTCLHRGTQLRTQPGRVAELRCPFHGFTWHLDGTFAGMPCPWDFRHLDPSALSLPEAAVATKGAHSRPGWAGSPPSVNGSGHRRSPTRVPPPGAENGLRPSSASRPDMASDSATIRSAVASGGTITW